MNGPKYAAQYGLELSYHIHTNLLVDSKEDWQIYMGCLDKAKLCIDVSPGKSQASASPTEHHTGR